MAPRRVRPVGLALLATGLALLAGHLAPEAFTATRAPTKVSAPELQRLRVIGRRASPYQAPKDLRPPPSAERSASGLAWEILEPGKGGRRPGAEASVTVMYSGWTSSDGQLFDTTYTSGTPSEFKLSQVISGWSEGIGMMEEGERRRLWIPASLGYGEEGSDPDSGLPAGDLVFDVKLVGVDDPGESIVVGFLGAFAVLLVLSFLVTSFTVEPERREYETSAPFSYRSL
mmetsp:Transcript_96555/g.306321  ORF Transcript_96555/g.306321 Transcript_96555/m.306321 type:complete len:229 (-) Transcript_96555:101-787(-)